MTNQSECKSSEEIMRHISRTYFNNECYVTHKEWEPRGFAVHHVEEIYDDVLRRNYPKGAKGRDLYLNDLLPLIDDNPDRFALIKNFVHTRLDHVRYGTTRFPMEQRERFCNLALRTIHRRKKK